jgi:hypothetical protein
MIESVLGALWFITWLIVVYGMATGGLCLWRRDMAAAPPEGRIGDSGKPQGDSQAAV